MSNHNTSTFKGNYNTKNPGVKRLMREAIELRQPTENYYAQPLDDNLFEWHFTIRGPPDSDFHGGFYHGRIILPTEYPMKPPSIILLTPNGRFETGKKICLSMSAHHPETWRPSWSIRTALVALIGFMPSPGGGAIGALEYTKAERQILAKRSVNWVCSMCTADLNSALLEVGANDTKECEETIELAKQIHFKGEADKTSTSEESSQATASPSHSNDVQLHESINEHKEETSSVSDGNLVSDRVRNRQSTGSTQSNQSMQSIPAVPRATNSTPRQGGQESFNALSFIQWFLIAAIVLLIARRAIISKLPEF